MRNDSVFGADLLLLFYFTLLGMGMGALSGLAPGIHVNTLAVLLIMSVPALSPFVFSLCDATGCNVAPELLLSCAILSAAVCHSFLDFIPSLIIGVPDETECLSVLPSHRLLLEGRGMDALQAAAQGSLAGATVGMLALLPLPFLAGAVTNGLHAMDPIIPWLLLSIPPVLIWSEGRKGDPIARLDVREGRSEPSATISLKRHYPVHGDSARVIGEVFRRRGRWTIVTPLQSFEVKGCGTPGRQLLIGHWELRPDRRKITAWSSLLFLASGALGIMAMDGLVPGEDIWKGMEGNMLMPLFTGLFGLPLLIGSSRGRMPPQGTEAGEPPSILGAVKGSLMGGLVGWLPGVTATAGAVLTTLLPRTKDDGPEGFISTVSAVGTGAAVLGLGTLLLLGKGRSGTLLAMKEVMPSMAVDALPCLLLSLLISSLLSYELTMRVGASMLSKAQGRDLSRLNQLALAGMVVLSFLLAGPGGLLLLVLSTALGMLPAKVGVSRVHLTGCLLLPILLYYFAPFLR